MTAAPEIKGWCPGALRPMLSGDGWVVRVRPYGGRLKSAQADGLASLCAAHGNGLIDLSNRANIQLRGVREETHGQLLEGLRALGLLDDAVELESRRNIVVQPFWQAGDDTALIADDLAMLLAQDGLPTLSGKFGYAVDAGPVPVLSSTPADIRLERNSTGNLIVVAEGSDMGKIVSRSQAAREMIALALWFAANNGTRTRMGTLIADGKALPEGFDTLRQKSMRRQAPGLNDAGALVALAFGQMTSVALSGLARHGDLRMTPWRMVLIEGASRMPVIDGIITTPDDPLLRVVACTGAPGCAQALGDTRMLARQLAPHIQAPFHISGCAKGCAHPRAAALTVTATADGYDIIRNGTAADIPDRKGLTPDTLTKAI